MKEYTQHTSQEQLAIQLKPIISYPKTAEVGETYLLTIDVQLTPASPWPYTEEEFEISFVLETSPFFIHEPLGEQEPGIVLHRFGGTYGAAEYLLTASKQEVTAGHIKIALLNAWGLPIAQLKLECEVKQRSLKRATKQISLRVNKGIVSTSISSTTQEIISPEDDVIARQLKQAGWNVQIANHLKQGTAILTVIVPSGNVAIKGYPSFEKDYLLFIDQKLIGVVKAQTQIEQFMSLDEPIPLSAIPQQWMVPKQFKSKAEQSLRNVPFVYYTTGYMTEFRNCLEPAIPPRDVSTFHQPATLALWFKQATPVIPFMSNVSFRANLHSIPDLEQGNLSDYQFEALKCLEQSLSNHHPYTIIKIEAGVGKTRLVLSSIYRLLKHANAKHILYIVDSNIMKQDAFEAFQSFTIPDDEQKFTDHYNVSLIGDEKLDPSAHVYIGKLDDLYRIYASGRVGERLPESVSNDDSVEIKRHFGDYYAELPIEYFDVVFLVDGGHINYSIWSDIFYYFDTFYIGVVSEASEGTIYFFKNNLVYPAVKINEISQNRQSSDALLIRQMQLSATIKSVRGLLRRDDGLSYETDRLSQLVWLLFLKSLDDFEETQEELMGDDYIPIIEKNYRWRDWATTPKYHNWDEGLLRFVNQDLISYLGHFYGKGSYDIRTIIGTIFQKTYNGIRSGYILRVVVDALNTINFNVSDDVHSISVIYDTLLKEMSNASGEAGEFYTPRSVVRFIIKCLKPQLGESLLDPACGTAGFLVEAYTRLVDQVQTPEQLKQLQDNLIGVEKKPMPYLLGITNMLLHGIASPNIDERNALMTDFRQFQDKDYVDIIATNPPLGGKEEYSVSYNFPEDMRTTDTGPMFIQYVMSTLKRSRGRCGIVLPNSFLFRKSATRDIRRRLLTSFNLHTIVRLPAGVFPPYTGISTNILFFEASEYLYNSEGFSPTKEIWYYEIPLPEGRNSYSKTKPMQDKDFHDCLAWWDNRVENEHAWKVAIEQVLADDCNLDYKNPRGPKNV